jgi:hypothetical protein
VTPLIWDAGTAFGLAEQVLAAALGLLDAVWLGDCEGLWEGLCVGG